MANFFARNLEGKGRLVRGMAAAALLLAGTVVVLGSEPPPWVAAVLLGAGAFVMFEALRGWCLMRACGFKTKL